MPPQRQRSKQRQRQQLLPPFLQELKHPFRLLVSGRSRSGKTTAAVKMIKAIRKRQRWETIYFICPTASQETYEPIRNYIDKVFPHATPEVFGKILKEQEKNPERRLLLILDDVSAEQATNTGRKGGLSALANNARWRNITIICLTQNLSSITPSLRDNAEAIMFFQTMNVKELQYMMQERNPFPEDKRLLRMISQATARPHHFLTQHVTEEGVKHYQNFG